MIYWLHEKEAGYEEWQVENAIAEGRITPSDYSLIADSEWEELKRQATEQNMEIKNNPMTNMPVLRPYPQPSKRERLETEKAECLAWFELPNGHDKHAIKCMALGLVFKDEYPDLYNEGVAKRARINEIEAELEAMDEQEK